MIYQRLIVVLVMLLLTACATVQDNDQEPTIAFLSKRLANIEPITLPPISLADVKHTYEQLVKSTRNDALKVVALQRLADLELENNQELIADDSEASATQDDALTDSSTQSTDIEEVSVIENLSGAIQRYEHLLKSYPDYVGNDGVMYQLARAYELNGELEKTLTILTALINKYPKLLNKDEIQFRRGEILFVLRRFEKAEIAYNNVLKENDIGIFYERAMFKKGWSVFKQGDTQRSLESYFSVLDRHFSGGRGLSDASRAEREMLEDTLRIISLSFSYLKGAETIAEFFSRFGYRQYEFRIYERLSDLYMTQNRGLDASETLMAFVKQFPQHRQSALFMIRVIDIYRQSGRVKQLLTAKADFVTAYGIDTPFWEKHNQALLTQLRPYLLSNLDDLTRYYHAEAQKTKSSAGYRLAAYWYRVYVRSFPNEPQTAEKHMLLAESLFDSGDEAAAAIEFEKTAYGYPLHSQSAEAAYAAVLVYRKQADLTTGQRGKAGQQISIASGKRFVTTFPHDKRAVAVMSRAAEDLYTLKDYPHAIETAHHVVSQKPPASRELLMINWAIIAHGEFELGMYPESERASLSRLKISPKNDKDRQSHLERLAAAIYKQGEQARTGKRLRDAAKHFLRVGELAPDTTIRINADYDAASSLLARNDWLLAIPILKDFIQRYPDHRLRKDIDTKLAMSYEKTQNWMRSAVAYEVLYRNESDRNKKRLLLWQVAEFYEKADEPKQAVEIYKRYVVRFSQPFDDAIEARFRLATIYKTINQIPSRQYWLRSIIKADEESSGTDRSRYLSAMATLELAEPVLKAYHKVHLVQPLKKNLRKKKKLMQESIQAYTKAANYGIEAVATASTFQIAEIYNEFSQGLFESERPSGLTEEELEQYDILLEEQAYPFEEKAIEVHIVNVERTVEGIYDQWVKKSFHALTTLHPIRYSKAEKYEQVNYAIE